jgi:CRISPR-associated exonuclease Cas4
MNFDNEDILLGKLIHRKSYSRERKNIKTGDVSFDFVKGSDGTIIFEIKKSSRLKDPAMYQLYYYLWIAKRLGVNARGSLLYPREKRRVDVELTPEIEEEMEDLLRGIEGIASLHVPPPATHKPYCRRCSYYELCMV